MPDRTAAGESTRGTESLATRRRESDSLAGHERDDALAALEQLSYYLDDLVRVPGTDYRVGLDPLLGLIPGVGDVATSTASAYIVARAAALGVPQATLARMLLVLIVDAVVGSLPLVGDVFDAAWKANNRNVRLLETRLDAPETEAVDRRFVIGVTVALTLVLVLVSASVGLGAWWLLVRAGVV